MAQLRFTLHIQREEGKALSGAREVSNAYFETHNQITFAWLSEGVPAARPLHNSAISLHPNGVSVSGFERENDVFHYQEWWLVPQGAAGAQPVEDSPSFSEGVSVDFPDEEEVGEDTFDAPEWLNEEEPAIATEQDLSGESMDDPDDFPQAPVLSESGQILWDDSMSVGLEAMDQDHRTLIDLINQIDPDRVDEEAVSVVGNVLSALIDYTDFHFRREEKVQEAVGYPALEEHRGHHEELKTAAQHHLEQYLVAPSSVDLNDLKTFLQNWLNDHILREDMAYKSYVLENAEAASAAAASVDMFDFDAGDPDVEEEDLMFQVAMQGRDGLSPEPPEEPDLAEETGPAEEFQPEEALEPAGEEEAPGFEAAEAEAPVADEGGPAHDFKAEQDRLFAFAGQLRDGAESGDPVQAVGAVLTGLIEYAEVHFPEEEAVMEQAGFPELPTHVEQHQAFLDQLMGVFGRYQEDPSTVSIEEVSGVLEDWLVNHVMNEEAAFLAFLESGDVAAPQTEEAQTEEPQAGEAGLMLDAAMAEGHSTGDVGASEDEGESIDDTLFEKMPEEVVAEDEPAQEEEMQASEGEELTDQASTPLEEEPDVAIPEEGVEGEPSGFDEVAEELPAVPEEDMALAEEGSDEVSEEASEEAAPEEAMEMPVEPEPEPEPATEPETAPEPMPEAGPEEAASPEMEALKAAMVEALGENPKETETPADDSVNAASDAIDDSVIADDVVVDVDDDMDLEIPEVGDDAGDGIEGEDEGAPNSDKEEAK
ncbi:MAG: bacteriohemerythrin [Rhodospirillales bacterium]|nr:bacteriohemerythrin [Rhodospirillales bacterium]